MPYALDPHLNPLTPTGVVNPAMVFAPNSEGRNVPTGEQEVDDNGVPIWQVEVLETVENFGRKSTETVNVLVPSRTEPKPEPYTPGLFKGLTLDPFVRQGRNGGRATLGKNFRATSLGGVGGEQK